MSLYLNYIPKPVTHNDLVLLLLSTIQMEYFRNKNKGLVIIPKRLKYFDKIRFHITNCNKLF